MESFETMFTAGGHSNSLGRSAEVLGIVQSSPARIAELFECIDSADAWVMMRAIDTFEKLVRDNPELARPYAESLVNDLTKFDQPSVQWHLAQLFAEIELSQLQQAKALSWLKSKISTPDVDWIVAVNTMKTLLYFNKRGDIDGAQLLPLFKIQTTHTSKAVRKKAAQFLDTLYV